MRRKRDIAIIVLRCAIAGFGASAQQAALGTEMVVSSKPAVEVIQDAASSNVSSHSLGMRLPESNYAPPAPLVLAQTDSVAPVAQAADGNSFGVQQETKNADVPAEPQAVMREIKSAARLSGSKQRRRKPKMAGVPTGLQAVTQGTEEPMAQAVAQGTKEQGVQAVAQGTEETETQVNPLAVPQETKKALVSPTPKAEAEGIKVKKGGKKYGMAPVQWGVRLSETLGLERRSQKYHGIADPAFGTNSETRSSLVNTQTAEIHARTYVIAPYLANLSGRFGLVHSKDASRTSLANSANPGSFDSSASTRGIRWFGDGTMSLFSQSRFPFSMSLGVSDSRDSDGLDTKNMLGKYLSLNQAYTPKQSTSTYNVGYITEKDTSLGGMGGGIPGEVARRSHWNGSYSTRSDEHRIIAETTYRDRSSSTYQNTANRMDSFTVQDIYLPSESLLTLQSVANIRMIRQNSTVNNSRAHDVRATTSGRWQPEDEDIPLFVDGNVRLSSSTTANQAIENLSQSLSGSVNANYFYSKNLKGYANGSVTTTNLNGTRDHNTTQLGKLIYTSNAIKAWKNSSYSWSASGGAANQTGSARDTSIFGGVGHGLSIPYPFEVLGKKLMMTPRVSQSLDNTISRANGQSLTFSNGGSVSLGAALASLRPDKELMGGYGISEGGVTSAATLSVLDTRTFGRTFSHKRTYSLALNLNEMGKTTYSRDGLEAEGTLGANQGTQTTDIFGKGLIRYTKTGVFKVRGLDYIGTLTVTPHRGSSTVTGVDPNAQDPVLPWILDQRLSYRIGQNEVLLRGLFSDSHGTKNSSLWLLFRAWRTVGN